MSAARKPAAPALRRGLLIDVRRAFARAIEMCGADHPDDIEDNKRWLRGLRREVLGLLREVGAARRCYWKLSARVARLAIDVVDLKPRAARLDEETK